MKSMFPPYHRECVFGCYDLCFYGHNTKRREWTHHSPKEHNLFPIYVIYFFLFPIWAWKPALMGATLRLLPHDMHSKKYKRLVGSLVNFVSPERHILHVTNSPTGLVLVRGGTSQNYTRGLYVPIYFLRRDSTCFGWYLPFITIRFVPSTEPEVPNSSKKKLKTWFGSLLILQQINKNRMMSELLHSVVKNKKHRQLQIHHATYNLQISSKFIHTVFFVPSLTICGGFMTKRFLSPSSGLLSLRILKTLLNSSLYSSPELTVTTETNSLAKSTVLTEG